ncbi:IclR family transcriptional regulator [Microbacterium ulmi]|uniref:Glycerol operon regulatory protein n=1 Tax=Microbacterium ulmi TaxID=179095 RepID=A0A7Y2Q1Q9_9MICO|nr:IclR family transcriptional regulator [Microbacterium ulmi]NII69983.1 DNA-binding IclR family transcriptional regulator [Microbacterium ulmi]NNH04587.1 IclR family transcriptional regulator [Microbacterium ulmi]
MSGSNREGPASQTLSRGIRILEILADERGPLSIDELAGRLGVHRSIAYRLVRTLEHHGVVARDAAGHVQLGPRLAALAAGVAHDLQAEALPELTAVANDLGMTCFLAVLDRDECITLASVEPRHTVASVAQRPGARHSILVGAPSKAILSRLPESDWPAAMPERLRAEIAQAAERGYATSHDEVIPTVQAVSVPLGLRTHRPAAIAVVHVAGPADAASIAERLSQSAAAIREALGG